MVWLENEEPGNLKIKQLKLGPFKVIEFKKPNNIIEINKKKKEVHMNRITVAKQI